MLTLVIIHSSAVWPHWEAANVIKCVVYSDPPPPFWCSQSHFLSVGNHRNFIYMTQIIQSQVSHAENTPRQLGTRTVWAHHEYHFSIKFIDVPHNAFPPAAECTRPDRKAPHMYGGPRGACTPTQAFTCFFFLFFLNVTVLLAQTNAQLHVCFLCSGSRSSKTFKPKKNIPEGSHQYELLKHAEATLGSGNLRQAVMLPEGEDLNEWIAVNSEWMNAKHLFIETTAQCGPNCHLKFLNMSEPLCRGWTFASSS